jgi:hypothetical protein
MDEMVDLAAGRSNDPNAQSIYVGVPYCFRATELCLSSTELCLSSTATVYLGVKFF